MSDIISITADGVIIQPANNGLYYVNFDQCSNIHFIKNDSLFFYWKSKDTVSTIKITEKDFLTIKKLYDNYQINKITFQLMQSDPLSSVSDIKKRATEFYLQKEQI